MVNLGRNSTPQCEICMFFLCSGSTSHSQESASSVASVALLLMRNKASMLRISIATLQLGRQAEVRLLLFPKPAQFLQCIQEGKLGLFWGYTRQKAHGEQSYHANLFPGQSLVKSGSTHFEGSPEYSHCCVCQTQSHNQLKPRETFKLPVPFLEFWYFNSAAAGVPQLLSPIRGTMPICRQSILPDHWISGRQKEEEEKGEGKSVLLQILVICSRSRETL